MVGLSPDDESEEVFPDREEGFLTAAVEEDFEKNSLMAAKIATPRASVRRMSTSPKAIW
jgi:hypothetical protein